MTEDWLAADPLTEELHTLGRILLVSVDDILSEVLTTYLRALGHSVTLADTPEDAREKLVKLRWDVVLFDWRPGRLSRHLVETACSCEDARVIVMLPHTHTLRWRAEQISVLNHPFRLREVAAKLCA